MDSKTLKLPNTKFRSRSNLHGASQHPILSLPKQSLSPQKIYSTPMPLSTKYKTIDHSPKIDWIQKSQRKVNDWIDRNVKEKIDVDSSISCLFDEDNNQRNGTPFKEIAVGAKGFEDFFMKYRDLPKMFSSVHEKTNSAAYLYLKKLDKYNELPNPMGLVKWSGPSNELSIPSYKMGDLYAKALSKGLMHVNSESVNLQDNRLTEKGVLYIISNLPATVKFLNLSYNVVGYNGSLKLGEYCKFKAVSLRELNLEETKLGDNGTSEICKLLADHQHLSDLNLSKNNITNASCDAIGKLVSETYYLNSLYLHWNHIRYFFY